MRGPKGHTCLLFYKLTHCHGNYLFMSNIIRNLDWCLFLFYFANNKAPLQDNNNFFNGNEKKTCKHKKSPLMKWTDSPIVILSTNLKWIIIGHCTNPDYNLYLPNVFYRRSLVTHLAYNVWPLFGRGLCGHFPLLSVFL